jgi:hypothetical protein
MRTHLRHLAEQQRELPLLVIDSVKVLLRSDDDLIIFGNPIPRHFAAILPKGVQFALIFQSRQANPNGAAVLPAKRDVVDRAPVAHIISLTPWTTKSIHGRKRTGNLLRRAAVSRRSTCRAWANAQSYAAAARCSTSRAAKYRAQASIRRRRRSKKSVRRYAASTGSGIW